MIDAPDPIDLGLGKGDELSLKTGLGRRLAQLRDRQFGAFRIAPAKKRQHAQLWRLEHTGAPIAEPTIAAAGHVDIDPPGSGANSAPPEAVDDIIASAYGEPREPLVAAPVSDAPDTSQDPATGVGPQPETVAPVPFMITQHMERQLRDLGYPSWAINIMLPTEAVEILMTCREYALRNYFPSLHDAIPEDPTSED